MKYDIYDIIYFYKSASEYLSRWINTGNLTRQLKVLRINISHKCFLHTHYYYYHQHFNCKSHLVSNIFSRGLSILLRRSAKFLRIKYPDLWGKIMLAQYFHPSEINRCEFVNLLGNASSAEEMH